MFSFSNLLIHSFLIQFANSGRGDLAAPQSFGNVFYPPDGNPGQVHFNERFLYTTFTTTVTLNNSGFKRHTLEPRYVKRDVARSRSEVAVIVTAAVPLAGFAALVAGCLSQLFCLGLKQFVQGFFHAAANQFFDLPLDYFLIKLYNFLGHGLLSSFRMVCGNFILPEFCKPCLFFICATYCTLSIMRISTLAIVLKKSIVLKWIRMVLCHKF